MSCATHQYIYLPGNSADRRRLVRQAKRKYPLTPFAAISQVPKQPYLSVGANYLIVTTPGVA